MCVQTTLFQSLEKASELAQQAGLTAPPWVIPDRRDDGSEWLVHLPEDGVLFSPHVEVFRRGTNEGYAFEDLPTKLEAVVSVAMPNCNDRMSDSPVDARLTEREYMDQVVQKWRAVLTAAACCTAADCLVLADAGCGVFRNPPAKIGRYLGHVLRTEFAGRFETVLLATLGSAGDEFAHEAISEFQGLHSNRINEHPEIPKSRAIPQPTARSPDLLPPPRLDAASSSMRRSLSPRPETPSAVQPRGPASDSPSSSPPRASQPRPDVAAAPPKLAAASAKHRPRLDPPSNAVSHAPRSPSPSQPRLDASSAELRLCSIGCGRPCAGRFNTCCRTCAGSGGLEHGPECDRKHQAGAAGNIQVAMQRMDKSPAPRSPRPASAAEPLPRGAPQRRDQSPAPRSQSPRPTNTEQGMRVCSIGCGRTCVGRFKTCCRSCATSGGHHHDSACEERQPLVSRHRR